MAAAEEEESVDGKWKAKGRRDDGVASITAAREEKKEAKQEIVRLQGGSKVSQLSVWKRLT